VCVCMVLVRLFLWCLRCFVCWFVGLGKSLLLFFFVVVGDAHVFIGSLPSCFLCMVMFMTCCVTFYEVLIMLVGTAGGDVDSSLCLTMLLVCLVF
jgi:hypothetical protein